MVDHIDGWHFASNTLRGGSLLPSAGEELPELTGTTPCKKGMYHASERAIDALYYAPGPMVARVRVYQHLVSHGDPVDKWAGQRRRMLTDYVDASGALREWARWCARQVAHLWDPSPDVLAWLWDGDEKFRKAAASAAWAPSASAAWAPPADAAWAAAASAAWSPSTEAACAAAASAAWAPPADAACAAAECAAAASAALDSQNTALELRLRDLLS